MAKPETGSGSRSPAPRLPAATGKLPAPGPAGPAAREPEVVADLSVSQQGTCSSSCPGPDLLSGRVRRGRARSQRVVPGPVVTHVRVQAPRPGVKVSASIAALSDDIALALQRPESVRVEAPDSRARTPWAWKFPAASARRSFLQGSPRVHESFHGQPPRPLTLALGKDIQGRHAHRRPGQACPICWWPGPQAQGQIRGNQHGIAVVPALQGSGPRSCGCCLSTPSASSCPRTPTCRTWCIPWSRTCPWPASALDWAVAEMDRRYQAMAEMGVQATSRPTTLKVDTPGPQPARGVGRAR